MREAEAFAQKVRRLVFNRQGTEAQVFFEEGFLYLRADAHARFAQGVGAERLQGFASVAKLKDVCLWDSGTGFRSFRQNAKFG